MYLNKNSLDFKNLPLTKVININPKILVVKYFKQNIFFSKIIGYNNIK